MLPRLITLPENESFFLFGARGVGKTTLLKNVSWFPHAFYLNLLRPDEERRFSTAPEALYSVVEALDGQTTHVIIDEVQKQPKLLDVVHDLIESSSKKFVLTGSSARKLKYGGANLLAGRAFVYHLHPFSCFEMPAEMTLSDYLNYGQLPKLLDYSVNQKKEYYLESYTNTYLKEEIWAEQFIRKLDPFRRFLEIAAQSSGKLINYSNIARDVGTSDQTIQKYFSILEDTLLGFFLEPYAHSFRKRLSKMPKFYFFDLGIVRTLSNQLKSPVNRGTSIYGELFEHFLILECMKLCSYFHHDYRLSYLRTKDGVEVDLVVERPGKPILFIEIKSSDHVRSDQLSSFRQLALDFGSCEAVCFSQDPYPKKINDILVLPWKTGLATYFLQDAP